MKKNVTKKEMEFAIKIIKQMCEEAIKKEPTATEGTTIRKLEESYNEGFKCCSEIILERFAKMEKGDYKF